MPPTEPTRFWFILKHFEQGEEPYRYRPLNRRILLAVGVLFGVLCAVSTYLALDQGGIGYLVPVVVFFAAAAVCLIVAIHGSDRAVSKIWGNR
jgi:hypothetical protein